MSEDGSEGSPARPVRRVRRVMVVSSASESEGDCSDVPLGTRRKRLRVLSDDGSDSSGSSIVARRRRTLRALRDSDADTDSSSSDAAAPKPTSGFTSDSSEGNSDKCSICLLRFKDQEVGTPETCEHIFCLDCITEWSQNVNTCPVDRITFNSIVVRACAGGRVLRTDPVKVAERRPSVDILMVEQPTACEVCGRTNDEDTMLLCDACDLGYHMQCLTPPLTEIPIDQWFCPNCDDMLDVIQMSELDDLLDGIDMDMPLGPRDVPLRQPRNTRRSARNRPADEPSTSSGRRANGTSDAPSTSRGTRTSRAPVRRRATTHRRKYKRRRTKTVIIEYDVEENGKFPVTKTVKRRVKKRKSRKKQPRTAARRSYVRASVRAQLAAQQLLSRGELSQTGLGVQELGLRRHRAGIPALSLLGNPNQLDYFSEEDADISEGATAAVAVASRPTSSILSAYRQARRKMVSIPSPSHAASAPDLLDSILHDQTKLHSKKSVVSITVDGKVDIKIESRERIAPKNSTKDGSSGLVVAPKKDEISNGRVDLSKAEDATRKAPSYPGQGRSGGGWGGGYRGNYHREHGTGNFSRGYDYGAGPPARPSAPFGPGGARRDDDIGNNYARRPLHYAHNDESFDRPRRHPDTGRGPHPHPDNRGSHILDNRGPHFNPDNNRGPNFNPDNNRGPNFNPDNNRGPNFNPDNNRGPNFMPENNRGPHMHENNRGPHMHESNRGPHMHDNNRGPHLHENNRGPHIHSENNRGTHMHGENNRGPHMQHGNNRGPHMQHENNQGPLPLMDNNRGPLPLMDNNRGPLPLLDNNRGPQPLLDNNRGPHNQRLDGRHSLGPWQPYSGAPRPEAPQRHSFGGFDDPLDMRMDPTPSFRPLPEPPAFKFDAVPDVDKSEEEEDSGLVIDTEKYDPTEPTFDEDSCSEEPGTPTMQPSCPPAPPTPPPVQALPSPPAPPPLVQNILTGLNTNIVVTSEIIDDAVRQVLQEHRNLIIPPSVQSQNDSDSDSDGDCPNFSIYSATSVHIASGGIMPAPPPVPEDRYDEDLVQQDDEPTPPPDTPSDDDQPETPTKTDIVRNKEEEYKEKVSKRCPITANTRNPIKIKLHTPALIKRQLTLYDDEDVSEDVEPTEESSPTKVADSTKKDSAKDVTEDVTEDNDEQEEDYAENKSDDEKDSSDELKCSGTPEEEDCERENDINLDATPEDKDDEEDTEKAKEVTSEGEVRSEVDDEMSEGERQSQKSAKDAAADDGKMTESLSETEDERSYTPCLDENKSKDTSLETDKDKGIEGLDTEMISEEEGNGIFSDNEAAASLHSQASPPPLVAAEEAEIAPAKKDSKPEEEGKKKKKKESKRDGKEKGKGKKKGDVTFKKLSKSGKERNYRERDKDDKKSKKERRESGEAGERRRRKERRKDLERYDVRSVVTEKRRKGKDAFGRDVSPRAQSATPPPVVPPSPAERRLRSPSPALSPPPPRRARHSLTPRDTSPRAPPRRDTTPRRRRRRSITPRRKSITPRRRSITPRRKSITPRRKSFTPRRRSMTPRRKSISPRRPSVSPLRRKSISPRRRSISRGRKPSPRRRRSGSRARKRPRRSASPKPKPAKKKKRPERASPRRKSPKRKRAKRVSRSPEPPPLLVAAGGGGGGGGVADWSPPSVDSRLLSPRTPPPDDSPPPRIRSLIAAEEKRARRERRRRDAEALRMRHRRGKDTVGPSKEVFTSGDNILVSVSFKDQERDHDTGEKRKRKESKRERRRKRRRAAAAAVEAECAKPIAIIDLERSPFREITPSPKNVIVLSDSDHAEKEADRVPAAPAAVEPEPAFAVGPKTPPEPAAAAAAGAAHTPEPPSDAARAAPAGPTTPPDSPDAYDPFEPTRSASGSPAPASAATPAPAAAAPDAPRTLMTLETAQKTNMSADEVLDRRPVSPMEKVMALLQSTRDVSPEPPPAPQGQQPDATPAPLSAPVMPAPLAAPPASMLAPAPTVTAPPVRIVLPSPTRAQQPKLFLTKPSPIKSNPVKPMQATKISRLPLPTPRRPPPDVELSPGADSPYSPGSSDFGDLFSPPAGPAAKQARRDTFDALFDKPPRARRNRSSAAKVPVKLNKKKGNKTQVGVKIDEDNLKILDDLPSSAVEMQVKSKFLKKLNRQERVVEEVKLVLKPHYNKKHVTKDEYKDILRRTVPKICHNKNGEINPTKIQSLVEAYVKKFRKKHKLGLL